MDDVEDLKEFSGADLEDSYFLGLVAEGENLELKGLFALTPAHPQFTPPQPHEARCYREGIVIFKRPSIVRGRGREPTIMRDPNGTLDLGSIELSKSGPNRFRLVTEWFDITIETEGFALNLSDISD